MQAGHAGTETISVGRRRISDWTHVAICLVSFAGGWIVSDRVAATEFSGGTVTGPILRAEYAGMVLLLLSAAAIFMHRGRLASILGLLAVFFCLPLDAFFIVPGVFYALFRGDWSVPLQTFFVRDDLAIAATVGLIVVAGVFTRGLRDTL
jgi:hypothetical protein